jgi:hypothetical protein
MTEASPGLRHLRAHRGGLRGQRVMGSSVSVPSWSGGSGLEELSVRLDLSMDFGGLAFSLSVVVVISSSMTPTSTSDAVETIRAACEAVRGRDDECSGIIWTR